MVIPSTIALKLTKAAEIAVKKKHPWVFEKSIVKLPISYHEPGSLGVLFDLETNKPFAFGLWDPEEVIKIKIIHRGPSLNLTLQFWKSQMNLAAQKREKLLTITNAYRAIHGENDNFPGLIIDVYNKTGVMKIYSAIWKPYLEPLIEVAMDVFQLESLVFRLSRKMSRNNPFDYQEGTIFGQNTGTEEVEFIEKGVKFYAYPVSGHKTGFFLDQRVNRIWVQEMAKGKDVLDVFSYVGSFGIHALYGQAKTLTSIDISNHAMKVSKHNLRLNNLDSKRWTALLGDAFDHLTELKKSNRLYDIVVIDPPAFAKQITEIQQALTQYKRLAVLGARLTKQDGYLLLASCSSRISVADFKQTHQDAFGTIPQQKWKIVHEVLHDEDHPIAYKEGLYLKTIIYQRLQ